MPLTDDGISSNVGGAAWSMELRMPGKPAAAVSPASPASRRNSRREGTSRFDDVRFILLRECCGARPAHRGSPIVASALSVIRYPLSVIRYPLSVTRGPLSGDRRPPGGQRPNRITDNG